MEKGLLNFFLKQFFKAKQLPTVTLVTFYTIPDGLFFTAALLIRTTQVFRQVARGTPSPSSTTTTPSSTVVTTTTVHHVAIAGSPICLPELHLRRRNVGLVCNISKRVICCGIPQSLFPSVKFTW